jgi:signal peptidase I
MPPFPRDPGAAEAQRAELAPQAQAEPARREWLGVFGDAARVGLMVLLFHAVLFNLSVVRGNSMSPGIHDGDRILVEPWSYSLGAVEHGDVVVLRYPLDPSVDYIKRVIGVPGDRVTLAGGRVWVNGELLEEPYVADQDPTYYESVQVREGCYYVLGDNRPRSSDSREFGQVPEEYLRGRVDLRLWPLSRLGFID